MNLSPHIVSAAPLLRVLAEDPPPETKAAAARAAGRAVNNITRDLRSLETAGLVKGLVLTDAGREALRALNLAATGTVTVEPFAGDLIALPHSAILPSDLNPRQSYDETSELDLAENIAKHGLLQNLVVRPAAGGASYHLVAGARRWRAIGRLIADKRWPAAQLVPAKVIQGDDLQHRQLALIENLQRKDLKPLEEARAFQELVNLAGFTTAEIAAKIHASQRLVQQRLQLLDLTEAEQARLDAGDITVEQARRILANRPAPFDLLPATRLAFLEIAHRASASEHPTPFYSAVEVSHTAEGSPELAALTAAGVAMGSENYQTAATQVRLSYGGRRLLAELTGSEDLDRDKVALAAVDLREQHNLHPAEGQTYSTPWLNPPFTVSAEAEAHLVERPQRLAIEQAQRDEADAARADERRRQETARGKVRQLAPVLDLTPDRDEAVRDALAEIAPLPWTWDAEGLGGGVLLDNDGNVVSLETVGLRETFLPLMAAALNLAAGLAPSIKWPDPEPAEATGEDPQA